MNKISSKKLINSKWTKIHSLDNERHFLVTQVELDENSNVNYCTIEAVITKREENINWIELKDDSIWMHSWK